MAHTQADLDALDAAIASGELVIKTQDRMVQYRSLAEMQQIRATIESSLAAQSATRPAGGISIMRAQFVTARGG